MNNRCNHKFLHWRRFSIPYYHPQHAHQSFFPSNDELICQLIKNKIMPRRKKRISKSRKTRRLRNQSNLGDRDRRLGCFPIAAAKAMVGGGLPGVAASRERRSTAVGPKRELTLGPRWLTLEPGWGGRVGFEGMCLVICSLQWRINSHPI